MLSFYLSMIDGEREKELFAQFYERYEKKLFAVALRFMRNQEAAEDAVHTSMVKIIEKYMEKFIALTQKPCQELEAWAVTIVKHTAMDMLEKESRTTPMEEWWDAPAPGSTESEAGYSRVKELIRAMPETFRDTLELRYVLEWSSADIAKALGITVSAVDARISRGRDKLIKILRKEGYEFDGKRV